MPRSDYVTEEQITRDLTFEDVKKAGEAADRAMAALANKEISRDEAILSHICSVEAAFYIMKLRHRSEIDHDALVCPAIDKIFCANRDSHATSVIKPQLLAATGPWMRASEFYYGLITGLVNFGKKQMNGVEVLGGRFVFYPALSFRSELRDRWFSRRWADNRRRLGTEILQDTPEVRAVVKNIDEHVVNNYDDLKNGYYSGPNGRWYDDHVAGIVERMLNRQFAHVRDNETWAGLSKRQVIGALTPICRRAARRLMGHMRAYKYLIDVIGAPSPALTSSVEVVRRDQLVAEVAEFSGLPHEKAAVIIEALTRRGTEERYGILGYPLIPLHSDRVAFMPSVIMFANWPQIHEKAVASGSRNSFKDGSQRVVRHTDEVVSAFRGVGYEDVQTEILISKNGKTITDLDVVVVDRERTRVLVVQLKSFLIPTDILSIEKAGSEVSNAVGQCEAADSSLAEVYSAIERSTGKRLDASCQLRQIIVVEGVSGPRETPPMYPAVSLEWLTSRVADRASSNSLEAIWNDAINLPDAKAFMAGVAPGYQIFGTNAPELALPHSVGVFAYMTYSK